MAEVELKDVEGAVEQVIEGEGKDGDASASDESSAGVLDTIGAAGADDDKNAGDESGDDAAGGDEGKVSEDFTSTAKYADVDIDVKIPGSLVDIFNKAGLDSAKVVEELYSGEFGLGAATHSALSKHIPAAVLDMALNGIRSDNDLTISTAKQELEKATEANKILMEATHERVGGKEAWDAMSEWAADNLKPDEIASFNEVMQSGNRFAQNATIDAVRAQWKGSVGDVTPDLIAGQSLQIQSKGYLTEQEYAKIMLTEEYDANPKKFDDMRRKGLQKEA